MLGSIVSWSPSGVSFCAKGTYLPKIAKFEYIYQNTYEFCHLVAWHRVSGQAGLDYIIEVERCFFLCKRGSCTTFFLRNNIRPPWPAWGGVGHPGQPGQPGGVGHPGQPGGMGLEGWGHLVQPGEDGHPGQHGGTGLTGWATLPAMGGGHPSQPGGVLAGG